MRYDQDVSVDGTTYSVHSFPATKALKILTRLTKLAGEPLALAAGGVNKDVEQVIPKMVAALSAKLDENEVESLIKEILKSVHFGTTPVSEIFDTHFQQRIGHLFKVLNATLRYQYGDFLGVLAASGGVATAEKQSNLPST